MYIVNKYANIYLQKIIHYNELPLWLLETHYSYIVKSLKVWDDAHSSCSVEEEECDWWHVRIWQDMMIHAQSSGLKDLTRLQAD